MPFPGLVPNRTASSAFPSPFVSRNASTPPPGDWSATNTSPLGATAMSRTLAGPPVGVLASYTTRAQKPPGRLRPPLSGSQTGRTAEPAAAIPADARAGPVGKALARHRPPSPRAGAPRLELSVGRASDLLHHWTRFHWEPTSSFGTGRSSQVRRGTNGTTTARFPLSYLQVKRATVGHSHREQEEVQVRRPPRAGLGGMRRALPVKALTCVGPAAGS